MKKLGSARSSIATRTTRLPTDLPFGQLAQLLLAADANADPIQHPHAVGLRPRACHHRRHHHRSNTGGRGQSDVHLRLGPPQRLPSEDLRRRRGLRPRRLRSGRLRPAHRLPDVDSHRQRLLAQHILSGRVQHRRPPSADRVAEDAVQRRRRSVASGRRQAPAHPQRRPGQRRTPFTGLRRMSGLVAAVAGRLCQDPQPHHHGNRW